MDFSRSWIYDPEVFAVGVLPPVADRDVYADSEEAKNGVSSLVMSLDGSWKAHLVQTEQEAPDSLILSDEGCELVNVTIPGEFQIQHPEWNDRQYANVQYPWEGHEEIYPPTLPKHNPTATVIREFDMAEVDPASHYVLKLGAVESCCAVWLNGMFIGYGEDSFTPHRHDVTEALKAGRNRLVLRIMKHCTGSWLEDQDFWRYSGIHRSVELIREPRTHLRDFCVKTPVADDFKTSAIDVTLDVDRPCGTVSCLLTAPDGTVVWEKTVPAAAELHMTEDVGAVALWSAESPVLYDLTMTLTDDHGAAAEVTKVRIGFRRFEIKDKIMYLNGKRILFHGVNRHEFDQDTGRVMSRELLMQDVKLMKAMNINAIRTSHYPNTELFYRICDEYGFYVIDETNMETHGTWAASYANGTPYTVPGSKPEWKEAVLARGRNMLYRDRNHASILIWSCGNESYGGDTILALTDQFHALDSTRPVHYEGVAHSPDYYRATDIHSEMYARVARIAERMDAGLIEKPYILCEYSHAMGNSCGGISLYAELEEKYPQCQGGFIWDYVDQLPRAKAPNGTERYAYGGDFGDRPSDWEFIANGIIFADRTLTPKSQEVRHVYREVTLAPDAAGVTLTSRRLYAPITGCSLKWSVLTDEKPAGEGILPMPELAAGETIRVELPIAGLMKEGSEHIVTVLMVTDEHPVLEKGTVLSVGQTVIGSMPAEAEGTPIKPVNGLYSSGVHTDEVSIMFDNRKYGPLSLKAAGSEEMLLCAPRLSLFRAPTDNDNGNHDTELCGIWHLVSRYCRGAAEQDEEGRLIYTFTSPVIPDMKITVTYACLKDGLKVDMDWKAVEGLPDMPAFGLSFRMDGRLTNVDYLGLGPDENYNDRRTGAWLGWHHYDVLSNLTPYMRPQECGSRGGIRRLMLTDDNGAGVEVIGQDLEISVLPYLPEELHAALHPDELAAPSRTILDVSMFRKGVGGDNSWGAPVLEQYKYPSDRDYHFSFMLKPCRKG